MTKLSRDDVLKLARLARLQLSEDEITRYQGELAEILEYIDKLQDVDVGDMKPTNQVTGLTNVWRKDKPIDYGYDPSELLKNVPAAQDGQLKVKRMIG